MPKWISRQRSPFPSPELNQLSAFLRSLFLTMKKSSNSSTPQPISKSDKCRLPKMQEPNILLSFHITNPPHLSSKSLCSLSGLNHSYHVLSPSKSKLNPIEIRSISQPLGHTPLSRPQTLWDLLTPNGVYHLRQTASASQTANVAPPPDLLCSTRDPYNRFESLLSTVDSRC